VPSLIVALPVSTGIETFNRQRIKSSFGGLGWKVDGLRRAERPPV
jgi:hypothetical protein